MAGRIKTWIWVVVAIVVLGIVGIVAMAGVGFYFFSKHFDTKVVSRESAGEEFDGVKARFATQKPLIELDDHGRFLRANVDRPVNQHVKVPDQLFVLAFDPDDQRIVKVTIPFWLLRMKTHGGTVDFNASQLDLEDLKLTVEDLERFGPTLIVDHKSTTGERVLVWSQ
jgi:flagellar basal body-associated protein FliL